MNETYQAYVQNIQSLLPQVELDTALLSLLSHWDDLTLNELIKDGACLRRHLSFLNVYKYGWSLLHEAEFSQEDLVCGASALKTAIYCLEEGVRTGNLVILLKGVFIYQWFELPFSWLKDHLNIELRQDGFLLTELELESVFNGLRINISLPEHASYSDRQYWAEYESGVREKDFKRVYELIGALERGVGYPIPTLFQGLLRFGAAFYPGILKAYLENKEPVAIAAIMSYLHPDDNLSIALDANVKNPWVLLEAIRTSLLAYTQLTDPVRTSLYKVSQQLLETDRELFFQGIRYFGMYKAYWHYNSVLGSVFAELGSEDILRFVEEFQISIYRSDYDGDRLFVEAFLEAKPKGSTADLLFKKMYEKWWDYLGEQTRTVVGQHLLKTNCFYFVVHFFLTRRAIGEEVISDLENALVALKNIESQWFSDEIGLRSFFFVNLTKLYLVCLECTAKNLVTAMPSTLSQQLQLFVDDRRLWLWYFDTMEKPEVLSEIERLSFGKQGEISPVVNVTSLA